MDKLPKLVPPKKPKPGKTFKDNGSWLPDDVDGFLEQLTIQEKKMEAYLKNVDMGKTPDGEQNFELSEKLADQYNKDGNSYLEAGKYNLATACYQEGIKLNYPNDHLRSQILHNLSSTYYLLTNFRSSLAAAEELLKLKPDDEETKLIAINSYVQLKDFDKSLDCYDKYLQTMKMSTNVDPEEKKLIKEFEDERLIHELKKRKLRIFENADGEIDLSTFSSISITHFGNIPRVRIIKNRLVWPVMMVYPELRSSICIPDFHEDFTFYSQLKVLFSDKNMKFNKKKFNADTVNMYCQPTMEHYLLKLESPKMTLSEAIKLYRYPFDNGIPMFIIFVAGQQAEKEALKDYQKFLYDYKYNIQAFTCHK